ncbi:MAG: hypothetical protein JNM31_11075 [Flavobacteriales bacterium]|nr:hypothetical protein [Flavobacteriales bacterium]
MRPILILLLSIANPLHATRVIHVVVALCDNSHQGIVKVPAHLGNGQDARSNLYWGAAFGVRTYLNKAAEWQRLDCDKASEQHILDRVVWKHRDSAVYLVAEAYEGRFIQQTVEDFLHYASGQGARPVNAGGLILQAGGAAHLLAYVGHDGLMDFTLEKRFPGPAGNTRETIILACMSKQFFTAHLQITQASPLLWTTGLMAPEAYTLHAAFEGWVRRETPAQVRERAATAYDRYQKCGLKGARGLLVTGW